MDYKILIVRNRFSGKLDFKKYLDWFSLYTPITIVTEEIKTDFDVTTEVVSNGTFTGVICGPDIITKLRTKIPENKYHAVVVVYGNKLNGIRVGVCDGAGRSGYLYKGTSLIQLCKTDDGGKQLNHELFHSFFLRLNRLGISLNDNMDTYLKNSDFSVNSVIDTNREIALETLKPYWDKVCSFKPQVALSSVALLVRKTSNNKQTVGDMISIKNGNICLLKSLEPKDGLRIPVGTYECEFTFSPKFQKNMYLIKVPNMEGIRIHSGNYYYDSEGCVMLGKSLSDLNRDGEVDLISSRDAIKEFETFFEQKPFTLIVV